ncbi:MAG TPA: hypothetical protein ENN45_03870, partial [Bacteroidetes bacterium]|nr:hypothetical protein [Bacteroidota bacterium]
VNEDISDSNVVFAVKEVPINFFQPGKTYVFFAHVIKGQKYNMPMLKKMMGLGCNLIDYEKIVDEHGRRLVFFGRYAGLAGMTDTLWAFGQRLKSKGFITPLSDIKKTTSYGRLGEIKKHLVEVGEKIINDGFPNEICPVVVGFAGYGNVSRGAQEIIDILPVEEIAPIELNSLQEEYSNDVIYKVVFKEENMVQKLTPSSKFDLQHYYRHPEQYKSVFERYVPHLSILMNCIYWDDRYPRLITDEFVKNNFNEKFKLQVVGDISVDVEGAIQFTKKVTDPGNPVFVYNPMANKVIDGYGGEGIAVMAVDNLPCELPRDSSKSFSETLLRFIPDIAKADFSVDFKDLDLPPEIKKAVILYHGKLTPDYKYISKFL